MYLDNFRGGQFKLYRAWDLVKLGVTRLSKTHKMVRHLTNITTYRMSRPSGWCSEKDWCKWMFWFHKPNVLCALEKGKESPYGSVSSGRELALSNPWVFNCLWEIFLASLLGKLDGVGPVDNRPSTTSSTPLSYFYFFLYFFFYKKCKKIK